MANLQYSSNTISITHFAINRKNASNVQFQRLLLSFISRVKSAKNGENRVFSAANKHTCDAEIETNNAETLNLLILFYASHKMQQSGSNPFK